MNKPTDNLNCNLLGRVVIYDQASNEKILDVKNAIHPQNMALAVARSLARENNGPIFKMAFGNGGTFLNSSAQINYRSPNIVGAANLYNTTYELQVDDQALGTQVANSVVALPSPSPATTSLVVVTCQLASNEPVGQSPSDNTNFDPNSIYTFDEIGLKTQDGLLLSHLVFNPIEKTANRVFLITYTLTVSVS